MTTQFHTNLEFLRISTFQQSVVIVELFQDFR